MRVTKVDELRRGVYSGQLWPGVIGLRAVNFDGQTVKRVGVLEYVYEEHVEAADLWSFLDGIGDNHAFLCAWIVRLNANCSTSCRPMTAALCRRGEIFRNSISGWGTPAYLHGYCEAPWVIERLRVSSSWGRATGPCCSDWREQ